MQSFLLALVQSVLTTIYWWIMITISYGLFGGSRNPSLPPESETAIMVQTYGTIAFAIILYAVLLTVWWRITRRFRAA